MVGLRERQEDKTHLYLVTLTHDGDAEEVDGVHVEGNGDDVEGESGVRHAGDAACPGQLGGLFVLQSLLLPYPEQ